MKPITKIILGIVIFGWDYILFSGWGWIARNKTCININSLPGELTTLVCSLTSPLTLSFVTLISIGITLYFIWKVFKDIMREDRNV